MSVMSKIDPQELLKSKFGWDEFKPGQLDVVQRLLDGKSVLSVFPTGGGKSLCYQLPALAFDGLTVVVSPLIALMKDQIDQLKQLGVKAVRLDSSLSLDEYRNTMDSIRSGEAKLLYVAPERFFNERFRAALDGVKISLFAIDEAHCISQWGHNFRPDYLKLAAVAEKLNVERVLCLTATATLEVQDDICSTFDIPSEDVICTEFFRPNLHIRSQIVSAESQADVLIEKLKSESPGATIVYVTLQKTATQLAEACSAAGLDAKAYHAGMDSEVRNEIQEWFMTGTNGIVVATIAFGMGIDKSDIRYVYHFNPPKSIENYAQEIGRAGRDGEVSCCELLFVPEDRVTLENFVFGDTPSQPSVRLFLEEIQRQPDEFFISTYKLSSQCDIKSIVMKTLLTYLELDGYIESTSPRYDSYAFKPIRSTSEIVGNFSGERQEFARNLFNCARKSKVWSYVDINDQMLQRLNCDRSRIVKALDYFAEKGWIELKVSGLMLGYRKLKPFESVESLTQKFVRQIDGREQAEIGRTRQVIDVVKAESCQANMLSAHFGQPLETPCGNCSACIGDGPFEVPPAEKAEIPPAIFELVNVLVAQHPAALNSPRSAAKFLCGLTSPALTKARLSRHASFGTCSNVPFDYVMQQVRESEINFGD